MVVAAVLCVLAVCAAVPCQAWADTVSTPDEFVAKAADSTVTSIEVTADMDMTGKGFLDVSGKTIDLGGCTISANNFTFGFKGTDFTVKNGTFEANGSGNYALFIGDDPTESSNVLIEDVTTVGGINIYLTKGVVLRNVNVTGGPKYYSVWCDEDAQVRIESGSFSSSGAAVVALVDSGYDAAMDIEGGTFTVEDGQPLVLESGNSAVPVVTGGSFNSASVAQYVPEGSAALDDSGTFSVMSEEAAADQAAAVVDGVYYKSAADARAAGGVTPLSYRVSFVNQGVEVSSTFVDENTTVAAPADPVRTGYDLKGWLDGDQEWDFGSDTVVGPLTLTAEWTAQSRTVTFCYNIGRAADKETSVAYGSEVSEPDDPTRDGFTFDGWFADAAFTQAYDFDSAVTDDITLYAKWTKVESAAVPAGKKTTPETPDLAAGSADAGTKAASTAATAKTGDASGLIVTCAGMAAVAASGAIVLARRKAKQGFRLH